MHLTKNKINVAELLKDCPKGMELDCTMIDNVVFEKLDFISSHYPIIIRRTDSNKTIHLTKYGQYSDEEDYKCVIFPKGKTIWDGFVPPCKFKDGDIVFSGVGLLSIFKGIKEGYRKSFHSYVSVGESGNIDIDKDFWTLGNIRLATKEEKQKLFDAIKENGYKWNEETKTLEKLVEPKFKVGDRIRLKNGGSIIEVTSINNDSSICVNGMSWTIKIEQQDNYELVPNKFDISTLKPFDKVLVRDGAGLWRPNLFGKDMIVGYRYFTAEGSYKECIPYEGNEHLLGTNNDCDEYFKIWEN